MLSQVLNCDRCHVCCHVCGCIFCYCGQLQNSMADAAAIAVAMRFRRLPKLQRYSLYCGLGPRFKIFYIELDGRYITVSLVILVEALFSFAVLWLEQVHVYWTGVSETLFCGFGWCICRYFLLLNSTR